MNKENTVKYLITIIIILSVLFLSVTLFATKIIDIERVERVWKCEKYLSPYGTYDEMRQEDGKTIHFQSRFTEQQKCYLNY